MGKRKQTRTGEAKRKRKGPKTSSRRTYIENTAHQQPLVLIELDAAALVDVGVLDVERGRRRVRLLLRLRRGRGNARRHGPGECVREGSLAGT